MSLIKDFLTGFINEVKDKMELNDETKLTTEEDILKAIDDLPDEVPEKNEELSIIDTNWYKDANWVKVKKQKCWSEFKYLGKPEFRGLPDISNDDRMYFTIPCGFEWDQTVKFWFVTFPANCDNSEIKDFFTVINPVEA